MENYYTILGVDFNSTKEVIKKAYRSLSKFYHPDKNPNDKVAEEKFKEINEAYEVLGNDEKRIIYNQKLQEEKILMDERRSYKSYQTNTSNNDLRNFIIGLSIIAVIVALIALFSNSRSKANA